MWSLSPPAVDDVDTHLSRALTYADGTPVYTLSALERGAILAVYQAYDVLGGRPDADLQPASLAECRTYICDGYGQVQKGGRLAALRATLLTSTDICPYCGFGEPTELDHFLPKGSYCEVAIYPRNLIPCCGPCNNAKRAIVPGGAAGPGFAHTYFEALPDVDFLVASADYSAGILDVRFQIDGRLLAQDLVEMLQYQLDRLKLNERYVRQINKFLSEQRTGILMLLEQGGLQGFFIKSAEALAEDFGRNDWRPVLLRALGRNAAFCLNPALYFGSRAAHASPSID